MSSAQTKIQVLVHNVVALDEQFTVSFVIEGDRPSDFQWEPGDDFDLLWGPQQGRSSSVQIINGKKTESSQTTYTYILRPIRAGKYTIAKARAEVGGKEIFSVPVTIEVVGDGASSTPSSSSNSSVSTGQPAQTSQPKTSPVEAAQDVFLVLSCDRTNVVVGEPIKAVMKLYYRTEISGLEGMEFPDFDGFWSQETYVPSDFTPVRESYNGKLYYTIVLREYTLIPQHSGSIQIDPAELVYLVNVRTSSGGASLFDGFFDEYTTVRKRVRTRPMTINVKPLPSGAPASFAGGVGVYSVSASLSSDSLSTHDAASLILKVTGKGNISLLQTPEISFPLDIEAYDPKTTSDVAANGLSGTKTYEYPFIPRSAGTFEVGPILYSYYDVNQHKYVTVDAGTLKLNVSKGKEYDDAPVMTTRPGGQKVENRGTDIRHIHTQPSEFTEKGKFFIGSSLFRGIAVAFFVGALLLWIILRKAAARRADVVGMKNRKATKMALKRLRFAGTLLKKDLYSAFYEELHNALLGYMSDKLNMPVSELSKERMSEVLRKNGVLDAYIDELMEILDSCEYARYAPSAGNQAMTSDYEKAVEVISSIDSAMKTRKGFAAKGLAVAVLMLSAVPGVYASENDSAADMWVKANASYEQGDWAGALKTYEEISDLGLESAQLYYNMGNSYYRQGELAKAVLYYERALKLDPSFEDAMYNLDYVNGQLHDKIETVPEFFVKEWLRTLSQQMSSNSWAVTFLVLLAVTLALFLVFRLSDSIAWRRVGFFTSIVTLLFMLAAFSFSTWQKNDYMSHDEAVVMVPVTAAKSSPSADNSTDLFVLHEGTKVKILERTEKWANVSLVDGRQGWMKTSDIEEI